jgi:hypothetical protein
MRKAIEIVGGVIIFFILVIIIYIIITGSVIVAARTVVVVHELKIEGGSLVIRPRPLVNESDSSKLFSKQPLIPFLGIGFIEEEIDIDEPQTFETSFAFYTLDEKTGNSKDSEYAEAYVIEGKIKKVLDWDKFITLLDVNEANYETKISPFGRKYTRRKGLLAEKIRILVASGDGTHQSTFITDTESGSKVINLNERINHIEEELFSRRNCIINLQDKFGFTKEEEERYFLIHEAPWYVAPGTSRFESLVNQAKELSGYLQSVYAEDLKPANLARRYVKDEDYIELLYNVWLAYTYEKNYQLILKALADIEKEKLTVRASMDERTIRYTEVIAASFVDYLKKSEKTTRTQSAAELKEDLGLFVDEYVLGNILGALQYDQLKHQYDAFIEYGRTGKLSQALHKEEKEMAAKVASDMYLLHSKRRVQGVGT